MEFKRGFSFKCLYFYIPQDAQIDRFSRHDQFMMEVQRDYIHTSVSLCDYEIWKVTQNLLLSPIILIHFIE
jgi:hypothetical protein